MSGIFWITGTWTLITWAFPFITWFNKQKELSNPEPWSIQRILGEPFSPRVMSDFILLFFVMTRFDWWGFNICPTTAIHFDCVYYRYDYSHSWIICLDAEKGAEMRKKVSICTPPRGDLLMHTWHSVPAQFLLMGISGSVLAHVPLSSKPWPCSAWSCVCPPACTHQYNQPAGSRNRLFLLEPDSSAILLLTSRQHSEGHPERLAASGFGDAGECLWFCFSRSLKFAGLFWAELRESCIIAQHITQFLPY